jgi:hypothetical protein
MNPLQDKYGRVVLPVQLYGGDGSDLADNGYQQIANLSAVTTLTVPANTVKAIVACNGADVRYRMDGVDPTANVGNLMSVGDRVSFGAAELAAVRFIQVEGGAILDIQYLKVA